MSNKNDSPANEHVTGMDDLTATELAWGKRMRSPQEDGISVTRVGETVRVKVGDAVTREAREEHEAEHLSPGATRALGAGTRERAEEADRLRTCFEKDRDRISHSEAFRRMAGKTQVFVFPQDHQRTRLTHVLEVAGIARSISSALGLNVALTEAIALGHDCGHGPGGHSCEDALDEFLPGGFNHAVWGADVVSRPLNLCVETLDGIRNHSWSRPAPSTPEGLVCSFSDRVAYATHDFEDAVSTGILDLDDLPASVTDVLGRTRGEQIESMIDSIVATTVAHGRIGMANDVAEALASFRAFNYERIYLRPESKEQNRRVARMVRQLAEYFVAHPRAGTPGSPEAVWSAVEYVAGMTDRFACHAALELLGYDEAELPRAVLPAFD
jgi:dGTPase